MMDAKDAREVFARAQWIWPLPQGYDLVNYFMQARRTFHLAAVPRRCLVKVTADSRYKLFVNGKYVCRGPARGFQVRWPYDEVDVAAYLVKGTNAVAILAHSYGEGNDQYITASAAGAMLRGRAGRVDFSTGPSWRVRRAPGYARHIARSTRQLGFEESFDARLDDGSWLGASYDDSDWDEPACTAAGAMPWHFAEPRGIPMMREEIVAPKGIAAECTGRSAKGWREAENLTVNFLRERRRWRTSNTKVRRPKSGLAFTAAAAGRGGFRAYVIDFGEEVVGSVGIEASGASGGEVIDIQACETLTGLVPDVADPTTGCNIAIANRLTLARGKTRHEQFEPWGSRYIVVVVRETRRPLAIKIYLRTTFYPLDVKAEFHSSNAVSNDIYDICVRTQRCCMLDAYVDCPWREQAQWWGDARVQGANTFHLAADARLFARGIRQIAAQEVPNGLTYGLTPADVHHCILPDYTLTWIMTLWDYYRQTGDTALVGQQAERMWRALSYFDEVTKSNGLIAHDERYWLFLDWADISKEGFPAVYNIMYFQTLVTAARLFRLIRKRTRAAECDRRATKLRRAIIRHLYDAKQGILYGGLDPKGNPIKAEAPHAYALAILSGLLPKESARFAEEKLLPLVLSENPKLTGNASGLPYAAGATPSPFFMHYVFEALKATGHRAEVVDCIRRWWSVFSEWGLTTTAEVWRRPDGRSSACHAWSAHPVVHLSNIVLGVTQAAVGWRKIEFAPLVEAQASAQGKVATPLGEIEVAWEADDGEALVKLALPGRISAKVVLPGIRKAVKGGRHRWTIRVG